MIGLVQADRFLTLLLHVFVSYHMHLGCEYYIVTLELTLCLYPLSESWPFQMMYSTAVSLALWSAIISLILPIVAQCLLGLFYSETFFFTFQNILRTLYTNFLFSKVLTCSFSTLINCLNSSNVLLSPFILGCLILYPYRA